MRYTLRMMGVPLDGPSWMFGDNLGVIMSTTIPHSSLTKRHNALAYHRIKEAVAAGIIKYNHVPGKENPADVLTKFLPHVTTMLLTKYLLFQQGDPFALWSVPQLPIEGSDNRETRSVSQARRSGTSSPSWNNEEQAIGRLAYGHLSA